MPAISSIDHRSAIRKFSSDTPNDPPVDAPSTQTRRAVDQDRVDAVFDLVGKLYQNEEELAELLDELELLPQFESLAYSENLDLADSLRFIVGYRSEHDLLTEVSKIRQVFGDRPPVHYMTDEAVQAFTRLYGPPLPFQEESAELELQEEDAIDITDAMASHQLEEEAEGQEESLSAEPTEEQRLSMMQQLAQELGGELTTTDEALVEEAEQDREPREPLHELTELGKFRIGNSLTLTLPKETMVDGITALLRDYPNKHLREGAAELFGGNQLPNSLRVPRDRSQAKPLPISASQHYMSDLEANMFLAVLFPGLYATTLSILSEVHKRAESDWLQRLIKKEGGPTFLDAGAGGAAAMAWQDLLKGELSKMDDGDSQLNTGKTTCGKTTVLAASDALRNRASKLLDNTSFIPRLPDYAHVRNAPTLEDQREPQQHKTYDVIVASHALWPLQNDLSRRKYVQNLWEMVNPEGGILIIVEKGLQRGYECVAGARQLILDRFIASPGSTHYERPMRKNETVSDIVEKEKGMLIAPDTHHQRCPMYTKSGKSPGRRDYISFMQRYHRPAYLNNILFDEKSHNHEDVQFSYVAVQRGIDLREVLNIEQGDAATAVAAAGFESKEKQIENMKQSEERYGNPAPLHLARETTHALALPRIIYPPMKRTGHIILDVCTPSGKIERWIVAKSTSRLAYKAARKAQWGDLWALGAKTRIPRNLSLGTDKDAKKEARKSRKRELREMIKELEEQGDEDVAQRLEKNAIYIPEFERVMGKFNPQIRITKKKIIKDRKRENRKAKKEAAAEGA
ncbi:37S ribosomal protein S22 [Ascosphaera pollenicola]|nr:37S ribosomal protein S22 [Ascosphaera pollenicola]